MNIIQICEVFFIATLISYVSMPFLQRAAFKTGYLDGPKQNKVHRKPIPLLGGVGIYVAFFITTLVTSLSKIPIIGVILIGCSILLVVGLVDDKFGMLPNLKLLGQFLAAIVVTKAGLRVYFFDNYYLNTIFTYLWIIGLTNAFNLLDNMNGLSSGIAVISSFFFGIICFIEGETLIAGFSFALTGASLGFLAHNFPKAKIFMGDSGSLVIGYLLAILGIWSSWQTRVLNPSLLVPLLVLSYPIFDTTLVTVMRITERRSIFEGGKDHSSHRLALLGLKKMRAVLIIYLICLVGGVASAIVSKSNMYTGIIIGMVTVVFFLSLGIRLSFIKTYQNGHRKHSR